MAVFVLDEIGRRRNRRRGRERTIPGSSKSCDDPGERERKGEGVVSLRSAPELKKIARNKDSVSKLVA